MIVGAHKNEFRWNEYNIGKVEKHGLDPGDAEYVVRRAKHPFPRKHNRRNGWIVVGQTATYRWIQVL